MMVACDIPLFKANHTEFKSFMAKYAQKKVPDQSTMRKHYLKEVYENVLEEIRSNIGDSSIFVSIDESTDKAGRYVCNVVVGPLRQGGRGYLLTSEVIPKVNASEIAKLFDNSLKLLWPEEVQRDKVLIFVTDAAPYMKKSVVGIQLFYPRIIHITCIAHGVHRICEKLRSQYANVDSLIANIKKAFSKSPSRIRFFKEKQPDLPLPPQPVLTRWGTWLEAASYFAKNFNEIKEIVEGLDDDAACVIFAKKLFANKGIREELAYIQANFGFLLSEGNAFKMLQKRGEPISNPLAILNSIENNLKQAKGPVAKIILDKFYKVFQSNQGLQVIKKVAAIVNGEKFVELPENIAINEVEFLNWAPLVSVDVERTFSSFKATARKFQNAFSSIVLL
ncbi:PREDICTED: uncharacterized protein LOC108380623 [Rhagoletis zephyria]|uniref:uncharacterized protein LOC108380623 n=1 Tax=Rhagoletis zephyria TaxID=28612 RepID=UPI0008118819|nr:PREDICTED: uncharacterized protein LOC108380623 [Rhagoletis zephyria]